MSPPVLNCAVPPALNVIGAPAFEPSMMNWTVPVGVPGPAEAVTVAVKVTFSPEFDGFAEEETVVVVPNLLTTMMPLVPLMEALTVSVPVIVWFPSVLRVALNIPTPEESVLLAGNTAIASVLVKWTVPAYEVAVLLN